MIKSTFMIHALPGMGADHRMFPAVWNSLPGFHAHDWPRCKTERSLPEVASTVCEAYGVNDGDVLVGASLGGMIACEIGKFRDIKTIYLVGSAINKAEISRFLTFLHPVARFTPFEWVHYCTTGIPDLGEIVGQSGWSDIDGFGVSLKAL